MPRQVVVIGAGPAGCAAAIAARRADATLDVTLVGTEDMNPYEKPPLSKAVLTEGADPAAKPIVPADALEGIRQRRGNRVVGIDLAQRVVIIGGERHPYDALVLATGATLRELPLLPRGTPNVFYLRDAADALALRAALTRQGASLRVAVVGAGLIGLEVAAAASKIGAAVTVVEAADRPMGRVCTPALAARLIEVHTAAGVDFRWGRAVDSVATTNGGILMDLTDGSTTSADLVVVGIGVLPDMRLAEEAGLAVDDGVLVDECCRSSDPAVFAAGDVARFATPWCKEAVRLENWRHALEQGEVAGINAAGGSRVYASVPTFWSDQYDLTLQGVGWPDGVAIPSITRTFGTGGQIDFHVAGGCLRYAVGIGAAREIAVARRLIDRKVPVDPAMLADPAINLQSLLRTTS